MSFFWLERARMALYSIKSSNPISLTVKDFNEIELIIKNK
jgi:hypothetical protein